MQLVDWLGFSGNSHGEKFQNHPTVSELMALACGFTVDCKAAIDLNKDMFLCKGGKAPQPIDFVTFNFL